MLSLNAILNHDDPPDDEQASNPSAAVAAPRLPDTRHTHTFDGGPHRGEPAAALEWAEAEKTLRWFARPRGPPARALDAMREGDLAVHWASTWRNLERVFCLVQKAGDGEGGLEAVRREEYFSACDDFQGHAVRELRAALCICAARWGRELPVVRGSKESDAHTRKFGEWLMGSRNVCTSSTCVRGQCVCADLSKYYNANA